MGQYIRSRDRLFTIRLLKELAKARVHLGRMEPRATSRRGSTVNWIKGVERTAVVGVAALLSLLLAVGRATAQPVTALSAERFQVRAERTEPMHDMCGGRRHEGRHMMPPAASAVPFPVPRSESASDDVEGAEDDEVPDAIAAFHTAPRCRPAERIRATVCHSAGFRC
jgi:hypothetical protein